MSIPFAMSDDLIAFKARHGVSRGNALTGCGEFGSVKRGAEAPRGVVVSPVRLIKCRGVDNFSQEYHQTGE
jgi:hypothetical protein